MAGCRVPRSTRPARWAHGRERSGGDGLVRRIARQPGESPPPCGRRGREAFAAAHSRSVRRRSRAPKPTGHGTNEHDGSGCSRPARRTRSRVPAGGLAGERGGRRFSRQAARRPAIHRRQCARSAQRDRKQRTRCWPHADLLVEAAHAASGRTASAHGDQLSEPQHSSPTSGSGANLAVAEKEDAPRLRQQRARYRRDVRVPCRDGEWRPAGIVARSEKTGPTGYSLGPTRPWAFSEQPLTGPSRRWHQGKARFRAPRSATHIAGR